MQPAMRSAGQSAGQMHWQSGASMIEMLIVCPILLVVGLAIVQLGLLYNARSIVNHAALEAARAGAAEHALEAPMQHELNRRLAPLEGGDGSQASAMLAVNRSLVRAGDTLHSRLAIINPTRAAFDDWAEYSEAAGGLAIPNAHLQHHDPRITGERSGMSLQQANLLEIEVVHGYRLSVPLVNRVASAALGVVDPDNSRYYAAGLVPLRVVSRVRMQSDVWEQGLAGAASSAGEDAGMGGGVFRPPGSVTLDNCIRRHGLPVTLPLPTTLEQLISECNDSLPGAVGGTVQVDRPQGSGSPDTPVPGPIDCVV